MLFSISCLTITRNITERLFLHMEISRVMMIMVIIFMVTKRLQMLKIENWDIHCL